MADMIIKAPESARLILKAPEKRSLNFQASVTEKALLSMITELVSRLEIEESTRNTKDSELQSVIDNKADKQTANGGFQAGDGAWAYEDGAAIGAFSITDGGGSVGRDAKSDNGGSIGKYAIAGDGFAGGYLAETLNDFYKAIDAIQLGTGRNRNPRTLQVYNYQLMDADGNIPIERMSNTIGDIDTALDNIIAIQQSLIGGGTS